MPYTGVAVGLETYRMESTKMQAQTNLIEGLKAELNETQQLVASVRKQIEATEQKLSVQTELSNSAQATKIEVQKALIITQTAYEKAKPRWFEKPVFLIGAGLVGGVFVGSKLF